MTTRVTTTAEGRRDIHMETPRFLVRSLTENDVNEHWAGWLNDPLTVQMLNARPRTFTLDELRGYVRSFDQIDRLLIGIFDRASLRHIGLAIAEYLPGRRKIRPSMLVGEPQFRNAGVLDEVEFHSLGLYIDEMKVDAVVINVLAHNHIAIAFARSRGWKLVQHVTNGKKSPRSGEPVGVAIYEFTRQMWEQRKSAAQKA